jgi:hypothetical protein
MTGLTSISDHLPAVVANYAQWPTIRHESRCEEDDCYDLFVGELGGYGALTDPRGTIIPSVFPNGSNAVEIGQVASSSQPSADITGVKRSTENTCRDEAHVAAWRMHGAFCKCNATRRCVYWSPAFAPRARWRLRHTIPLGKGRRRRHCDAA